MYKVLIVDDDRLICEDIEALIDWVTYGYELVGEAENGADAIKLIQINCPDILITDIYMPVMNGIDLIKYVRTQFSSIKIIVISNYDDFKYVKEALKLGAIDYMLKYEIEKQNLLMLLENCKQLIISEKNEKLIINNIKELSEKGRIHQQNEFWKDVIEGNINESSLLDKAEKTKISIKDTFIPMLIDIIPNDADHCCESAENGFRLNFSSIFANKVKGYVVQLSDNQFVIIHTSNEKNHSLLRKFSLSKANEIHQIISENMIKAVIVTGKYCMQASDIHEICQKYAEISEDKFYKGTDIVIDSVGFKEFSLEIDTSFFNTSKTRLVEMICSREQTDAINVIKQLSDHIQINRYQPQIVYNNIMSLIFEIQRTIGKKNAKVSELCGNSLLTYKEFVGLVTLGNVEKLLIDLVDKLIVSMIDLPYSRIEVRKAVEIINKRYMTDLNLCDIAQFVNLSKNYFCRIFREETGDNYIDFLNKVRIENAKLLLLTSNCKITEIAQRVGLDNYRYFCKVFKQYTGKRPNEYRQE